MIIKRENKEKQIWQTRKIKGCKPKGFNNGSDFMVFWDLRVQNILDLGFEG